MNTRPPPDLDPHFDGRDGAPPGTGRPPPSWVAGGRGLLRGWWAASRGFLQAGLLRTGIASLYVSLARVRGAVILMYHSVAAPPEADWVDPENHLDPHRFERHISFLARRRRPVRLSDIAQAVAEKRDLPPGTVAVTIDDGYRDTLTVAAPILSRLGVPATLYLATGYVDRGENQWIDQLYAIFRCRTRHALVCPWDRDCCMDLSAGREAKKAYRVASRKLLPLLDDVRKTYLAEMGACLRPEGRPPRLTMTWDEARELRKAHPGIEIGGHTRGHLDLQTHGKERGREEILGCFQDIRTQLGTEPKHFSFPYGRRSPESSSILREAGAESAVRSGADVLIGLESDRLSLARLDAPASLARLGFVTSGACPGLLR